MKYHIDISIHTLYDYLTLYLAPVPHISLDHL